MTVPASRGKEKEEIFKDCIFTIVSCKNKLKKEPDQVEHYQENLTGRTSYGGSSAQQSPETWVTTSHRGTYRPA